MHTLSQDLRYALRTYRNAPMFAAVAVLSIALGIGANTAIFTLLDQVLLRLLPVKDPRQLVLLTSVGPHYGNNRGGNALSYPMYKDFRDNPELTGAGGRVFSGMLCRFQLAMHVGHRGRTERVSGELVSGNYFSLLGVGPAAGRLITEQDDRTPGGHPVVVLSHGYWQSRFAGDPAVIGQTIAVNSHALTIIGVAADGFEGLDIGNAPQVFVPVMMKPQMTPQWNDLDNRRSRWVNLFGRMKPGITMEQAKAALAPAYKAILEMEVKQEAFARVSAYTREQFLKGQMDVLPGSQGRSGLRRRMTRPLWALMAMVAVVLLIACANVANLLLARAASRQKEIAIRLAMGAGRRRVLRQLLVESLALAFTGGLAGIALAWWLARLLLAVFIPEDSTAVLSATPDLRILAFNFAAASLTGVLFGLAPALQATRSDIATTLKDQAGAVIGGGHVGLRKGLVIAQVTLSLLLLIGAGLFVRSLGNLKGLDPGFRTANLVAFSVDPTLNGYAPLRAKILYGRMLDEVRAIPGVSGAAFSAIGVLQGDQWDSTVTVEGYQSKPGENMNPWCNAVSPGYFHTMGIPLLMGRDFNANDANLTTERQREFSAQFRVAIANHSFVKHYFGDRNPIGRHIGFGGNPGTKTPIEIVGVVGDAKYSDVRQDIPRQLYFPYLESDFVSGMTMYVRAARPPEETFNLLRATIRRLDANLPLYGMRTVQRQMDLSLVAERLVAMLAAVFGALATLLALIGLYGVMAYVVARRTREMGIRLALGARPSTVSWMVMREALLLLAIGIAAGLPASWALSRLVASQLYGVTPNDAFTMVMAACLLAAIGCAAGYVPAYRASRIDPVRALRYE